MSSEKNEVLEQLRMNLREKQVPFFEESELKHQLDRVNGDLDTATYNCLLIKAEECSLSVSGLSIADSSTYWLRLAAIYRPNCTTTAKGG